MNILDKLFSREIQRRTGAHAINIYIDSNTKARKRSRSRGAQALDAAKTTTKITTTKSQGSLLHRLNIRLPWFKFATTLTLILIVVLDLVGLTISKTNDSFDRLKIAPMSHHVKATERIIEGKKLIALTFDDGPMPATTPRLLDVLTEKDAPATFFMLGFMARNNPDIVKRAAMERHEIASHTMYHQNLVRISSGAAQADLDEAKSVFKSILGDDRGPAYVRPPYGNYNGAIANFANRPLILWSVDTEDWLHKDVDSIVATAMREVHDGAIILMHDIYPTSVDAVPVLIDRLRQDGYEFVTLSELAKARGVILNPGEAYYSLRP